MALCKIGNLRSAQPLALLSATFRGIFDHGRRKLDAALLVRRPVHGPTFDNRLQLPEKAEKVFVACWRGVDASIRPAFSHTLLGRSRLCAFVPRRESPGTHEWAGQGGGQNQTKHSTPAPVV
jgi:hypothetical protein